MPNEAPDQTLLASQQRQILTELGSMRDDMAVLTAIAMRALAFATLARSNSWNALVATAGILRNAASRAAATVPE